MTNLSKHAKIRAQQRGIKEQCIKFICQYGDITDRGYIMTRDSVTDVEKYIKSLKKQAYEILNSANFLIEMKDLSKNILVPFEDDTVKTVFRTSKIQRF